MHLFKVSLHSLQEFEQDMHFFVIISPYNFGSIYLHPSSVRQSLPSLYGFEMIQLQ